MLDLAHVPIIYAAWRERQSGRDERMSLMDDIVRGNFSVIDPDEDEVDVRSPNLIQVALEDTSEAAALVPTIRVSPHAESDLQKRRARAMEMMAVNYLDASEVETLIIETLFDLAAFGIAAWVSWPDVDQKVPLVERRDPRTCYPDPGWRPGERCQRAIFAREVYWTQLPEHYKDKFRVGGFDLDEHDPNVKITIVEYIDDEEVLIAGLYETGTGGATGFLAPKPNQFANTIPVELERIDHGLGKCPVTIGARITLDNEFRGQFDQVVRVLEAHIRLTGMVLDYADQAVYSDVWVRDLVGEMPYGGGAFIELGPNGAIGRVPPAVNSLNVQQDLAALTEAIHLGGRYPKSRPGEIDQSIASAKFLEASAGMMNTAIKTYHLILKRMFEQTLPLMFLIDKTMFPGDKMMSGILRNQSFLEKYTTDDIELDNRVVAEYGLGLGREPAQAAVLMLQYAQNDYISHEFVQENIEGVVDVGRERARIDVQKFRDMMLARLLQGLETGVVPEEALIEISRDRLNGDSLEDLYERYILQPRQDQLAMAVQGGQTGAPPLLPGSTPGAPQAVPGGPPAPGQPGGPAQPQVPGAPQPSALLARLGVSAGPGGLLGAQIGGQG